MKIGFKLATEALPPEEVVRQTVAAEKAGFDFVELSDHYHPWLEAQGHSGFTWSMLGAMAVKTERIGLVTGVTCPSFRYHPAIIAQAAATVAILSGGRFTLGVGAGERLNEHVIGTPKFPGVHERHEYLKEALDIINLLWRGGYQNYDGKHLQLEDARVFDLSDELPVIAVAAGGKESAAIAAEKGGGLFATEPKTEIVDAYRKAGGNGPKYAEVALAWAENEDDAVDAVLEKTSFFLTGGWKVLSELPNVQNFEAAASNVTAADVRKTFSVGPHVDAHVRQVQKYVDAGFDHLVLMNAGPDPDGFIDFFQNKLAPQLRTLA